MMMRPNDSDGVNQPKAHVPNDMKAVDLFVPF